MLEGLFVSLLGVLFLVLGYLLWRKEMITLLHDYHRDRVSPENKKALCTLSGIGMIAIGGGLLISGIALSVTSSLYSFIPFALGFAVGLAMMMYAIIKYNR